MVKSVQNVDEVARKLGLALTRASNHRFEFAREERRKREKMVKRRKTEVMAGKCCRNREGISSSSEEEGNYESFT